nr:unnamed protein product [Callosobruchus chinensis]
MKNIIPELLGNPNFPRTRFVDCSSFWKKARIYLFRARKYFSPSNLLTLYKAQIRPSLEYYPHIWGAAAPSTLSILDAVQRRAIRLIGDPTLKCHLQPLSHRCGVRRLSLFYRYSNGLCSSELTFIHQELNVTTHLHLQGIQGLDWTAW